MSGRYRSQRGWERRRRTPTWIYALVGVLLLLAIALGIVVFVLLGNDTGGLAAATSTPTPPATATLVPTEASTPKVTPGPTPSPTPEITPAVTPAATPEATPGITPSASGSPLPSGSFKPTLLSFTAPVSADCHRDYGYGSPGYIRISWESIGTTGVRISIDPPAADGTAYHYGYKDEPPSGSDWVPFTCGPASHLYVVTTLHTTGYYQWRYHRVTQLPPPSATP
jgi:hypothetical protein